MPSQGLLAPHLSRLPDPDLHQTALRAPSAVSIPNRYGQKRPPKPFWLRTSHGYSTPICPRGPSEAHRQFPSPTGTDKNSLPGPSGSAPLSAAELQPAPEGSQRPIGSFHPQQVRAKTASQGLLAPHLVDAPSRIPPPGLRRRQLGLRRELSRAGRQPPGRRPCYKAGLCPAPRRFGRYPINGAPMRPALIITAYGERSEATKRRRFLYGSYKKVEGIPTVHIAQALLDTTTSWQIPSDDKDTNKPEDSKAPDGAFSFLSGVRATSMLKITWRQQCPLGVVGQRMALFAAMQASAVIRSRKSPSLPPLLRLRCPVGGLQIIPFFCIFAD